MDKTKHSIELHEVEKKSLKKTRRDKEIDKLITSFINVSVKEKNKSTFLVAYFTNKNNIFFSTLPLSKIMSPLGVMLVKTEIKKIKINEFKEDEDVISFIFGGFGAGKVISISKEDLSKEELKSLEKEGDISFIKRIKEMTESNEKKEMLLLHVVEKNFCRIIQHDVISVDEKVIIDSEFVVSPTPILEKKVKSTNVGENVAAFSELFK